MLDVFLSSLVKNGTFGAGSYVSSFTSNAVGVAYQFGSKITFMTMLIDGGGSIEVFDIVLKQHIDATKERTALLSKQLFTNELIMYKKVLPCIKAEQLNIYPKLYHGFVASEEDYTNDILVLEDIRQQSFIAEQKLYLNYDQIVLALKKLGYFHSFSYLAKRENNEFFFSILKTLRKTSFCSEVKKQLNCFAIVRALKSLIREGIEVDLLNEVLNKIVDFDTATRLLMKPKEPFAVVCHGDFCLNNLLYKYDNTGTPTDLKFVDFQTSVYSSPAVDLSFLLYMNTDADIREQYWDDFLQIYWESFSENIPRLEFNFQQFLDHFAKHAVLSLCFSAFFLVGMSVGNHSIFMNSLRMSYEECKELALTYGAEKGTEVLTNISKHILKHKYFHKYLELY